MRVFFTLVFTVLLASCSKDAYPIKERLHRISDTPLYTYETAFNKENLFQLRISQTVEFLPTLSKDNLLNTSNTLISDFPFKRFQQEITPQTEDSKLDNLVVEETYLYLDEINSYNEEESHNQFGLAFYFITYPTVDEYPQKPESRTRKYFNNPKKLYANIIRGVTVGYWIKNSNDELLMVFQKSSRKIMVFKGIKFDNRIEIQEISHPYNLDKRSLKNSQILSLVNSIDPISFRSDIAREKSERIDQQNLDTLFNRIKSDVVLIELDKVIDLNDRRGLLFFNLPQQKKFIFEDENNEYQLISGFKLGSEKRKGLTLFGSWSHTPLFYFQSSLNGNEITYLFNKKNVVFLKNDW